jgi:hypothetical protein
MLLALPGCVTDRDYAEYLASNYYSRADIDALAARAQCKALARNLLQIARCDSH